MINVDEDNLFVDYYKNLIEFFSYEDFVKNVETIFNRDNIENDVNLLMNMLSEHKKYLLSYLDICDSGEANFISRCIAEVDLKTTYIYDRYNEHQRYTNPSFLEEGARDSLNNDENVKILFAKNKYGNIIFDKAASEISKGHDDKLERLYDLLSDLRDGVFYFGNYTKEKALTGDTLKGIIEKKDNELRFYYLKLDDYYVVIGAEIKKDDWGRKYMDYAVNVKTQGLSYYNRLKSNKELLEDELEFSKTHLEELIGPRKKEL